MKRFILILVCCLLAALPLAAKEKGKVALLFLMVGEHSQATLWGQLMKKEAGFNAYVHNKEWLSHPYFLLHMLPKRVNTTWIEHMNAWRYLLSTALMDKDNERFVFLSDGCVPLRPMAEIYNILMKEKRSRMSYSRPFWPKEDHREVLQVPEEHRYVNSEWIAVNRQHAQLMIEDQLILEHVKGHSHSAEAYPSILFSYYNHLKGEVLNKPITYVDFLRGRDSHPYVFEEATSENRAVLQKARQDGYLFVRKIGPQFPAKLLLQVMKGK